MLVGLAGIRGVTLGRVSVSGGSAVVVPGHSSRGRVSRRCLRLLDAAARLAEREGVRTVVLTGGGARGAREATQMAEAWSGRRDVELVVEPTARNTAENAARSLQLLLERGIDDATVVCAPQHLPRVHYLFGSLYGRYGVRCHVQAAWRAPHPFALAHEVAAFAVARRQRRAVLAELETALRG
jgi:DUF218 domain